MCCRPMYVYIFTSFQNTETSCITLPDMIRLSVVLDLLGQVWNALLTCKACWISDLRHVSNHKDKLFHCSYSAYSKCIMVEFFCRSSAWIAS